MVAAEVGSLVSDKLQVIGGGVTWGDYDNDGFLDLFVAGGRAWGMTAFPRQKSFFYRSNNGDGTFTRIQSGSLANDLGEAMGVYWLDYDRDGFLDLFVQDEGSLSFVANRLYRNSGNSNHWLIIKCVGTSSPRFGTGAKVRVKTTIRGKEMWQLRLIDAGGTCWGGQSFEAHFGLGEATNVDTLKIEWPSGIVQVLHDVAPKQILTVTEPPRLEALGVGRIRIQCWKGQKFETEVSSHLLGWTPLGVMTNETGTLEFIDPDAAGHAYRFYRAKSK
jgi:hypothetical protein